MLISRVITTLSSVSLLAMLFLGLPAEADTTEGSSQLLPLESRSLSIEVDPNRFDSAANEINAFDPEQSGAADLADILNAGFLEGLVDEDGDVNLPLGLTIFDAMGTTSVGFGEDF
jgi:ABC-type transport system substrate-binding protein